MAQQDYKADSIKALEGLEAVRKRPGMYIGDTGVRGLHHLVTEVVDNCIDEAMAGYASHVSLTLHPNGSISIVDDGRGIPTDWHAQKQMSALTVVMTVLHAGGKFEGAAYKVSGGLHGVGVSVVNALSEWLEVEVYREGSIHFQRFERGIPHTEVEQRGKTKRTGTRVAFKPDPEIFADIDIIEFDYETLANRMRELAFLNKGLTIALSDEREEDRKDVYCYQGGIKAYVEHLNQNKSVIHSDVIYFEKHDDAHNVELELALQYNDGYSENVLSFANNINTHEGGTHLSGFRSALTRCLNAWGKRNNVVKEDNLQGEDCREGLSAVVSIRLPEPQFEGQTKTKLGNRDVQGIVEAVVNEGLGVYFEEHPGIARSIVNRAVAAAAARQAARKARDLARRKNALSGADMPGKLADCISRDRESTEIYLVEGDSAGGSAKVGRDTRTQAILPLKGKILNVEKHRLDKVLEHKEITAIVSALGTGIGKDEFDLEKLRYGKIIIMTDADVDGSHIRTLILTFFYRYMPDLIRSGHVFIAQPPLYRVKRRQKVEYVLSEEEMNRSLVTLGLDGTHLEYRANGASVQLEGEDLDELVQHLVRFGKMARSLEKKGMELSRFLSLREKMGAFPKYRAFVDGEEHFFVQDEDFNAFIKTQEAEGESIEVHEEEFDHALNPEGEEEDGEAKRVLDLIEYVFAKDMERSAQTFERFGFNLGEYDEPADPAVEGHFFLVSEKNEMQVRSLGQVLHGTIEMGRRGLEIQRYKGLGEMDPEQLWETTMDPDRRTLLQVKVGDAAMADQLFTILMGELVEPRREFIERHASDVTNLDV